MCKIDTRRMLPEIMRQSSLGILAIGNGLYRIARFDPFIDVNLQRNNPTQPICLQIPKHIMSMNAGNITSESAVLDAAKISGALDNLFGEKVDLTIRGRKYSPSFELTIDTEKFKISGVQIEIDGGYEGQDTINLVEAKMNIPETISLRQIAYPHSMLEHQMAGRKEIRSYICFYAAPVLHFIRVIQHNGKWILDVNSERKYKIESS